MNKPIGIRFLPLPRSVTADERLIKLAVKSLAPQKLILLLSLVICGNTFAQDTIYWSANYKLRWEDFKGSPDTSLSYTAVTTSGIDYSYVFTDTSFTYKVAAFFVKPKSWKKPLANSFDLRHEQLHFDISELFARKLRNELSKLKPIRSTVKKAVDSLVRKIIDEKEYMQDQYDEETDFGRNATSQQKWERTVSEIEISRCRDPQ